MPNDPGTALTVQQQRAMQSREFNEQLDRQVRNFELMLPKHVSPEKFRRVVVTAVIQDQKLFQADRNSLFMAAQKCASDGLLPDGREAVLLPFNTKTKETLPDGTSREGWKNLVTYIPMIAGIRQRMRNTGLVTSAEAYVVYRNDKFFQKFGSDPQIVHEPPQLGTPRGDVVGAYAIIRLTSGEVIQEVMDKEEIERIRNFSKAKSGPAWTGHWGEMARKTVLRRAAKSAPTSAEMLTLLQRDDDDQSDIAIMGSIEPEPPRAGEITHQPTDQPPTEQPSFLLVDCDGEEHEFFEPAAAAAALAQVFDEAVRRGSGHVAAARENNADLIAEIGEPHPNFPAGDGHNGNHHATERSRAVADTADNSSGPAVGSSQDEPNAAPAGDEMKDLLGGKSRRASCRVKLPERPNSDDWTAWHTAISSMIGLDPPHAILADNRDNIAIFEQVDAMRHNALMRDLKAR